MDWFSHLLAMAPVSGRLDLRCLYGAPGGSIRKEPRPAGWPTTRC
jgi:hypothetical protein